MMVYHKQTYAELLRTATLAAITENSVRADSMLTDMQYRLTTAYSNAERIDLLKHAYESTTNHDLSSEESMGAWFIVNIIEDRIGVDI